MKSKILIYGGLLLIAAALYLGIYNLWDANRAKVSSQRILADMEAAVSTAESEPSSTEIPDFSEESLPSSESSAETLSKASERFEEAPAESLPEYVQNPDMEMPEIEIEGHAYIGRLDIPELELSLPVMSEWTYPKLRLAPCRYKGSVYQDSLIICAHNYDSHFGRLGLLEPGSEVIFTDTDGNVFSYQVSETELLAPSAIEEMESGGWDLTLFTCTIGGKQRVTVRCERKESPKSHGIAAMAFGLFQ